MMAEYAVVLDALVSRLLRDDCDSVKVAERAWGELAARWQKQGELREPENLLFQIARLRCIDRQRQLGRHPEDLSDDVEAQLQTAETIINSREFAHDLVLRIDVRRALKQLPLRQRQAAVLAYGWKLPQKLVAALLGATPSQLNNLLRSAKATLTESPVLADYRTPAYEPKVR